MLCVYQTLPSSSKVVPQRPDVRLTLQYLGHGEYVKLLEAEMPEESEIDLHKSLESAPTLPSAESSRQIMLVELVPECF